LRREREEIVRSRRLFDDDSRPLKLTVRARNGEFLFWRRVTATFDDTASAPFVHRLRARAARKEFTAAGFPARQDDS
jgi:hypothetical protein